MLQIDYISLWSTLDITELRSQTLALNQEVSMAGLLVAESEIHPKKDFEIDSCLNNLQNILHTLSQLSESDADHPGHIILSILSLNSQDEVLSRVHQEDITLVSGFLQSLRRQISVASKQLLSQVHLKELPLMIDLDNHGSELFDSILKDFSQSPFGLKPHSAPFPIQPAGGIAKQYQELMTQIGQYWVTKSCQDTSSPLALLPIESTLLRYLWASTIEILRPLNLGWMENQQQQQQQFSSYLEEIDQNLRDALYREGTNSSTAVFIGAQNSGKSTLLNSLIGSNILPIGLGPITALPSRIVHIPGKHVAELSVDVTLLNKNIALIRQIPRQVKEGNPKYVSLSDESKKSLEVFESEEFELQSPVQGAENVQKTLEYINDVIRFSKMYSLAYDGFLEENWAVISLEFPKLKTSPAGGRIELIDLPGLVYKDKEHFWDTAAQEAIRRANIVVAVVAATGYHDNVVWRTLPDVIAKSTHIRATIVVCTKIDAIVPSRREVVRKGLMEHFWPESTSNPSSAGLYLDCSAGVDPSMEALEEILAPMVDKPEYDELQNAETNDALHWLFDEKSDIYQAASLEGLKKMVANSRTRFNLKKTRDEIFKRLTGDDWSHYYTEEARGVSLRLRRLINSIEGQTVVLGLSPRDTSRQEALHASLEAKATLLRSKWNNNLRELREDYDSLAKQAAGSMESSMGVNMTTAFLKQNAVSNTVKGIDEHPNVLEFDSEADLLYFMDATQKALRTRLEAIQLETLQKLKEDAVKSYQTHLSGVIQEVGGIDSQAERKLSELDPFSYNPEATLPTLDITEKPSFLEKRDIPRGRAVAFRKTQERILSQISSKKRAESDSSKSIDDLSPLLRALLATVSFVPFALYYPFSSRMPASTRYVVDLDGLRKAYKETILHPWTDVFSVELQKAFQQQTEDSAGAILESALQTALQDSAERLRKLKEVPIPKVDETVSRDISCNYCNLVAAYEALGTIAVRVDIERR